MSSKNTIYSIFFTFITALIISACSGEKKKTDGYVIKGNLEHANGQIIYLAEITESDLQLVDSMKLNEDENFKFMGNIDEPGIFLIYRSIEDPIKLIVDTADNITIKGDITNLTGTYEVSGTGESSLAAKLNKHLHQNLNILDSINYVYKISQSKPDFDTLLLELNRIADSVYNDEYEFLVEHIKSNPGSLSNYIALTQQMGPKNFIFNPSKDLKYFQMAEEGLKEKHPASKITRGLTAFIKEFQSTEKSINNLNEEVKVGSKAPEITLKTNVGELVSLSSFRDKIVLLDFWATWCKPCRMENPILVRLHNKYKASRLGFEIFHVSLDRPEDKKTWERLIKADNMLNWVHVIDEEQMYADIYQIEEIPLNFLIDKNGIIIAKNLKGRDLENKLKELFNY